MRGPAKLWNVPNALTILRLCMVPVVVCLLLGGRRVAALAVFVAAALTDLLDGFLARRNHQITSFGKLADPFADKLMIVSTLLAMALLGDLPLWIAIVALGKDLCLVVGGILLLKRRSIIQPSRLVGKTATALFMAGMVMTFLNRSMAPYNLYVLYVATAVSIVDVVSYIVWGVRRAVQTRVDKT